MILAGDVGGTKTILGLFDRDTGALIRRKQYASGAHAALDGLIRDFLLADDRVAAAGFGVAGPVVNGKVQATNLPWWIDAAVLADFLQGYADGPVPVTLANDLVASGTAALASGHDERVALNPDAEEQVGHVAVIAAGTGLGEALFHHDGARHLAMPTEGGHCDFAPNSPIEDDLLVFLRHRFQGHVSYERILSGSGFLHLYEFARQARLAPERSVVAEALKVADDPNAVITRFGVAEGEQGDGLCRIACALFARIYGAEAGNLALKGLTRGGVFVAGAIAGHILPLIRREFMAGFLDKGRFGQLLEQMPVWMISDPDLALKGAHVLARRSLDTLNA